MNEDKKPEFAFEKKLGIAECMYGDINFYSESVKRLFVCMQETNKLHNLTSEFFRLDMRYPYADEHFPYDSLVLHLSWGSKKEVEKAMDDE